MSQKFDNDPLGNRMKEYEDVTNFKLPRKSYILGRIDGNAFHTYTKGLKRPFDEELIADMDATAIYVASQIQNCKFAFVQSDEISVFVHEEGIDTQPWFSNKLQKMDSIAASKATSEFNKRRYMRLFNPASMVFLKEFDYEQFQGLFEITKVAEFDARFWTVPSAVEVHNYFLWRQRDAEKNSISAAAQALYSPKELENKNGPMKQEMMFQKGINWNNYPSGQKRGRFIEKRQYVNDRPAIIYKNDDDTKQFSYLDGPTPMKDTLIENDVWVKSELPFVKDGDRLRSRWEVVECPIFSQDINFLLSRIKTNA